MLLGLEGLVDGHARGRVQRLASRVKPLLHHLAVRQDVQPPFREFLVFVLLFADDDRRDGFPHPCQLTPQELFLLLVFRRVELRLDRLRLLFPVFPDEVVHLHACQLVDADEHRLAVLPRRRVVPDEIAGDLVEAFRRRDDVVVALELRLQLLGDVNPLRLERRELFGDLLVDVLRGDVQLLPARVVVERNRRAVIDGTLEVVLGDVVAEHLLRQLVALEERRAREADVPGVRQGVAHVERKESVLRAVRLV